MELTKQDREFIAAVEANTPKDFPNLVCGWPDEEHSDIFSHDTYLTEMLDRCDSAIWRTEDGEDVTLPEIMSFAQWKDRQRAMNELGFSNHCCDLCGSYLAGNRYAATALPENPAENPDYVALTVCQDCLLYIANGDLPEES